MKKATLTTKQIETLMLVAACSVRYENDEKAIEKVKQISEFLKQAWELHLIDDYSEVSRILKEVGNAAINESNQKRAS